jgi:hypothetical protein
MVGMSNVKKYEIHLTKAQREQLVTLTNNGQARAKKIKHAQVLLMADAKHVEGRWTDEEIASVLHLHRNTVARIRQRFVTLGEGVSLERKVRERGPIPQKLDGKAEAQLVAICCSEPPAGRVRWTLSLLADELKRRKIVTSICCETVRSTLKKTNLNLGVRSVTASLNVTQQGSSPTWKPSSTSTAKRIAKQNR